MGVVRNTVLGLLLAGWSCSAGPALADKRVALVLGNSRYQHAPNLTNPANDSAAVNLLLKSSGFDVVTAQENLGVNEMRRAVRDFSDQVRDADIAVIYYAGHGIEVGGINYLVPVDASLRRDIDVEDETVSLDRLLQVLEPAKRLRLVILDACRDNPFTKFMSRTMASRAVGRGLARVEPVTSDTLIAFAAKAGSTAADGSGMHSPFTSALLKHMVTPGLDVRLAFGRVRDEVLEKTANKQEPFVYGSLGGKTVTLAALPKDDRMNQPSPVGDPEAAAARDYEAATKVNTKAAWEAFLRTYPGGFYAELARAQLAKLARPASASVEPTKPQNAAAAGAAGKSAEPSQKKPAVRVSVAGEIQCCINHWRKRQGGSFAPEGQSTSNYKSASDLTSMCNRGVPAGSWSGYAPSGFCALR